MEPERYTSQLPADLTYELALRLPWRELYESYIGLPEYRRYDTDHHLWRTLYRRDLSTYPLPDDVSYREQYFWGQALLDNLDLSQEKIVASVLTLIRLGYDVPLGRLIPLMAKRGLPLAEVFDAAIEGGYLSIIKLLYQSYRGIQITYPLRSAIIHHRLDIVNHLLDQLPAEEIDTASSTVWDAAEAGNLTIFDRVFLHFKNLPEFKDMTYLDYLPRAVEANTPEVLAKILEMNPQLDPDILVGLFERVNHLSVLHLLANYLMERGIIKGLAEIDTTIILRAAVNDCDLEHLKYVLSQVEIWHVLNQLSQCGDADVHRSVVEMRPQQEFEGIIARIIQRHPELVNIYLDALTKDVDEDLVDIVQAAIRSNDVELVRRVIEHPHLQTIDALMEEIIVENIHLVTSPELIKYLLSLLPPKQANRLRNQISQRTD